MELQDVMEGIINNNLPKLMIFFGDEQKILDIYLDKISSLGYTKTFPDTVPQAISMLASKKLMSSNRLIIVREDKDFVKAEGAWQKLRDIVETTDDIVVLRYTKIAKNIKFYKQNKDICVEFPKLDVDILSSYIRNSLQDISDESCTALCEACSNDYGRILLEIDKIQHYMNTDCNIDANTALNTLLNSSLISKDVGDITFDLTNAVTRGDVLSSFILLEEAKKSGEPVLRICSILYTNFRNMLAVLCLGKDTSNASARTGIDNKRFYMIKKQCGAYNINDCIRNIRICQSVETGIKNGYIEQDIALDYLITSLIY